MRLQEEIKCVISMHKHMCLQNFLTNVDGSLQELYEISDRIEELNGIYVLLVLDDGEKVSFISDLLAGLGCSVVAVHSQDSVKELVRENSYDLILVDLCDESEKLYRELVEWILLNKRGGFLALITEKSKIWCFQERYMKLAPVLFIDAEDVKDQVFRLVRTLGEIKS